MNRHNIRLAISSGDGSHLSRVYAIRPVQEKAAEQQLEDTMHEKPSLIMLLSAKQETSRLLGEDAENRQARQKIMRRRSTEQLKRSHLKTDRCKIER